MTKRIYRRNAGPARQVPRAFFFTVPSRRLLLCHPRPVEFELTNILHIRGSLVRMHVQEHPRARLLSASTKMFRKRRPFRQRKARHFLLSSANGRQTSCVLPSTAFRPSKPQRIKSSSWRPRQGGALGCQQARAANGPSGWSRPKGSSRLEWQTPKWRWVCPIESPN